MGNFNRGRSSGGGGRGFGRRDFNDRGSRGPVQMHQAVCSNCGQNCEVPFRPTSGKPIFCSSCFENNRGSDSRNSGSRNSERFNSSDDRRMFDAVCAECGNSCKVPFQPSGEKPVYCSNCFGEKKGSGDKKRESFQPQPQHAEQFELLNNKLDRILAFLTPNAVDSAVEQVPETVSIEEPEELVEVKKASSKKKSSKA